jgi:hypothetical protein
MPGRSARGHLTLSAVRLFAMLDGCLVPAVAVFYVGGIKPRSSNRWILCVGQLTCGFQTPLDIVLRAKKHGRIRELYYECFRLEPSRSKPTHGIVS